MPKFIRDLLSANNESRANVAVLLVTCGVLSLSTLILIFAIIFSAKNLIAELGTVVGALAGLSGHAYYSAKRYPDSDPPAVNT